MCYESDYFLDLFNQDCAASTFKTYTLYKNHTNKLKKNMKWYIINIKYKSKNNLIYFKI